MLNMNSPTVQNLMQSGFNPYTNSGYIPQQQPVQNYALMNNNYPNLYNPYMFSGYMNPILMQNQMDANRIRQREEAIQQGKIWRRLLQGEAKDDETLDVDEMVQHIESFYYYEPPKEELSIKDKILTDKNNHIAEVVAYNDYCTKNNIPIMDSRAPIINNISNYYNTIESIAGDDCDMVDYFTRVYPELQHRQLEYESERFQKNLKNRYNSKDFNKLIDQVGGKSDSYYAKLMESYAESGVRLETSNGAIITADEMEIRLPDSLLRKQQEYQEQRKKFYNAIFNKGE